jgi:hypothetical protein
MACQAASGSGFFVDAICTLEGLGLLSVLLPFLLIFTLVFAVLQKSKILGDQSNRFNTVIAFVIAMATVIPHVIGRGPDVVVIINRALPNVSVLMVAALMILLLIGVFGKDVNFANTSAAGWIVLLSIIAVAYTFLVASGVLASPPAWLNFLVDPQTRSLLIAILVFGIIVWFITKEEHPGTERRSVNDTINNMFGGVLGGRGGGGGHH